MSDGPVIRPLWESNRWDGPLSGVVEVDGRLCSFSLADDSQAGMYPPDDAPRTYNAYPLTDEEAADARRCHALFRARVGTHCDYTGLRPDDLPDDVEIDGPVFWEDPWVIAFKARRESWPVREPICQFSEDLLVRIPHGQVRMRR